MATSSVPVFSRNYVFDSRPRIPFRIAVKRYWTQELCLDADDQDTFAKTQEDVRTLVFIHGSACHKEHWELTIQRLFENGRASTGTSVRFRDMWSLDMPNHGDSAILNEEVLRWGYDTFSWEHHARSIHAFLTGQGTGVDVDFSKRRLSLVGHSLGASVLILVPTYYPLLNISSLHLLEPHVVGEKGLNWVIPFVELAAQREDIWPNVEAAYQALRVRRSFRNWDDRILRILIMHGLRSLPTAEYPDRTEGVTLKLTRRQQAATFRDLRSMGIVYRHLHHILKEIPTHIVYGEVVDNLPYDLRQEALHVASGGISNFKSVTTLPGIGHMMLETHPKVVADFLWRQLSRYDATSPITDGTIAAKL